MTNSSKDYYQILGLSKGASIDEVKKAYRKLAREHHPDVAKDKKVAEARFKEINEAYQILSSPEKKKMYDTYGHVGRGSGFDPFGSGGGSSGPFTWTYSSRSPSGGSFGNFDPFDVFEEFFGFRGFGGAARKGKNLYYTLDLSFKDAVKGLEKEINLNGKKLKIKIPSGVRRGTELRFEGEGEQGPSGRPSGDLFLTVNVATHPRFQRFGNDIYIVEEISVVQATVGDTLSVPVVDPRKSSGESTVKLKVPAGTQPGTDLRLKGKGMPNLRGRGKGDMYVRIKVVIPEKVTKKQKKILEEFEKET